MGTIITWLTHQTATFLAAAGVFHLLLPTLAITEVLSCLIPRPHGLVSHHGGLRFPFRCYMKASGLLWWLPATPLLVTCCPESGGRGNVHVRKTCWAHQVLPDVKGSEYWVQFVQKRDHHMSARMFFFTCLYAALLIGYIFECIYVISLEKKDQARITKPSGTSRRFILQCCDCKVI